jgi:hypothetical protein
VKMLLVLGVRNPQSIAFDFGAFVSRIKRNTLIISLFLTFPREMTIDNGKQFDCYSFKEYCKTLGTHAKFLSVYHLQSNGAVERANGLIFSGIKKCLFDQSKGKWVDELPRVPWSHNTTVSIATCFTPFLLLFCT